MQSHYKAGNPQNIKTIVIVHGMHPNQIHHLIKFLPKLAEISEPLRPLLSKANIKAQNKLDWKKNPHGVIQQNRNTNPKDYRKKNISKIINKQ